jgi:hypothetical protein
VVAVMLAAWRAAGGTAVGALAPAVLSRCSDDALVLAVVADALRRSNGQDGGADSAAAARGELLRLVLLAAEAGGRAPLLRALLARHPWLAAAPAARLTCRHPGGCAGHHTLLHAAAAAGDVEQVRAVLAAVDTACSSGVGGSGEEMSSTAEVVNMRDCAGDSALGLALRLRHKRVARELVRSGAQVVDLVGCAARGGGRLRANQVWFKEALDVD